MQNIINTIATIIVSIGGTGVIILGIAKYIGNILAKNMEEKYKNKKGFLIDNCLNAQYQYINMIEYYLK